MAVAVAVAVAQYVPAGCLTTCRSGVRQVDSAPGQTAVEVEGRTVPMSQPLNDNARTHNPWVRTSGMSRDITWRGEDLTV